MIGLMSHFYSKSGLLNYHNAEVITLEKIWDFLELVSRTKNDKKELDIFDALQRYAINVITTSCMEHPSLEPLQLYGGLRVTLPC
ncbi:DNA repair and recombination protein [Pyrenophora teres f. teres]|uniref:DNA repair and recombination protein n=1 Tax=Pyrenophora teres f. teres TaxID=97479 RepID=A0A6S6W021_9PLEO|nr:DNA repair and recombination protein [Pyrenophora teres f. teres]